MHAFSRVTLFDRSGRGADAHGNLGHSFKWALNRPDLTNVTQQSIMLVSVRFLRQILVRYLQGHLLTFPTL